MMLPSPSAEDQSSDAMQKRLAYVYTSDGFRNTTRVAYQFEPLNLVNEEIRILVLQPCSGDKNGPYEFVKCTFEVQPLTSAESFIAIRNARGYRLLQEVIEIDESSFLVASALEKFLRHLRKLDEPIRLWARYICVNQTDRDEMSKYWTREFADKIYDKAQSVVDMHVCLRDLLDQGAIETSVDSRYKEWNKRWNGIPESLPLPKVFPIKLGKRASNDAPSDDYEYLPLDVVANEIRIIVIANSPDPAAPLLLHLAHCPIGSDVAYHALSYTWGVDTENKEIIVNGLKMRIRKNLEAALRSIRSPTHGVAIWVDAICINQSDTIEKSRELPRIAQVWEKAVAVVCYIGDPDATSDLALDFVSHLQEPMIRTDGEGRFKVGKPERMSLEELPTHCAALYLLLMRPYFRRCWVLLEIAVASNPVIACGMRRGVSFEQLDTAAYNLQDMLSRDSELSGKMKQANPQLKEVPADQLLFVRKLFYFRHSHMGRGGFIPVDIKDNAPGYLETAILSRDFQATVPHDKVFSLWNLARNNDDLEYRMDYSKTYEQAFVEFAKSWALYSGSLDVLGAAEYMRPTEQAAFYATAPSWCPDWSQPSRSSSLIRRETFRKFRIEYQDSLDGPVYSADGAIRQVRGDQTYFEFVGDELHCLGIILDTVLAFAKHANDCTSKDKINGLIPSTADFCTENDLSVYEDIVQAMIAMLHGDVPTAWPKREDNLGNTDADYPDEPFVCIPYKLKLAQQHSPNASRHVPSYAASYSRQEAWEAVCTVMRGRKTFITEKGYVGLIPDYVEAGSSPLQIALLATCSVPVLLQENADREGSFRLLGTCFVQGWMEGEVLTETMGCETPGDFWEAMVGSEKLVVL